MTFEVLWRKGEEVGHQSVGGKSDAIRMKQQMLTSGNYDQVDVVPPLYLSDPCGEDEAEAEMEALSER